MPFGDAPRNLTINTAERWCLLCRRPPSHDLRAACDALVVRDTRCRLKALSIWDLRKEYSKTEAHTSDRAACEHHIPRGCSRC